MGLSINDVMQVGEGDVTFVMLHMNLQTNRAVLAELVTASIS